MPLTMAENPFYNRFYAYDMNEAQGYQYTYCAYFWDAYYTWIRLVNDVVLSIKPVVESLDGKEDVPPPARLKIKAPREDVPIELTDAEQLKKACNIEFKENYFKGE